MAPRELPTLDPRAADETITAYGYRIVMFLIACEVTATLATEDLELARHTVITIYGQHPSDTLVANLRVIERILSAVIDGRTVTAAPETTRTIAAPPSKPNIGPMAPLSPPPIARPPAPERIRAPLNF